MNLKARVLRWEKFKNPHSVVKITIDVFDRIVNDAISDEEFARSKPIWKKSLLTASPCNEPHAQSV